MWEFAIRIVLDTTSSNSHESQIVRVRARASRIFFLLFCEPIDFVGINNKRSKLRKCIYTDMNVLKKSGVFMLVILFALLCICIEHFFSYKSYAST